MKLAVISDLHIDEQRDEIYFEKVLAECVDEAGADMLLIAGDISEYYLRSMAFIRRLKQRIAIKIYFTPGNHDLWSKYEPGVSVQDIVEYMKSKNGDIGFVHNDAAYITEKTVLIGGCGWYDYSFAYKDKFTKDHLAEKRYMGRWWRDSLYAKHGMSDPKVDSVWNEELQYLVDKYSHYDIVFMTHMVNHPSFLVGPDHERYDMFQYFNGFLGSEGLYNITKNKAVKYAISGHVHYRRSFREGNTYYMCRCLGYPKEFPAFGGGQSLKSQIADALEIIEVD